MESNLFVLEDRDFRISLRIKEIVWDVEDFLLFRISQFCLSLDVWKQLPQILVFPGIGSSSNRQPYFLIYIEILELLSEVV